MIDNQFSDGIELGNTLIYPKYFSTWTFSNTRPCIRLLKGRGTKSFFDYEYLTMISRDMGEYKQWITKYPLKIGRFYHYSNASLSLKDKNNLEIIKDGYFSTILNNNRALVREHSYEEIKEIFKTRNYKNMKKTYEEIYGYKRKLQ